MKIKYKFTITLIVSEGISAATDSILTVDSANKTTTVNHDATYVLTVNNGTNADTFNLIIENPQNAMAGLSHGNLNKSIYWCIGSSAQKTASKSEHRGLVI